MTGYLLEVVGAVALERAGVHFLGERVEVCGRGGLEIEMTVAVDAANEKGGMASGADVAHGSRHIADADADAPVLRTVGAGLMDGERVVQGELSGREAAVDRAADLGRVCDPLFGVVDARVQAVVVRHLAPPVTARDELHAAASYRSVRQREPRGNVLVVGLKPEVRRVLVPARHVRRARFLDEPRGSENQDVRPYHVLDGVEDRRVTDQLVRPAI